MPIFAGRRVSAHVITEEDNIFGPSYVLASNDPNKLTFSVFLTQTKRRMRRKYEILFPHEPEWSERIDGMRAQQRMTQIRNTELEAEVQALKDELASALDTIEHQQSCAPPTVVRGCRCAAQVGHRASKSGGNANPVVNHKTSFYRAAITGPEPRFWGEARSTPDLGAVLDRLDALEEKYDRLERGSAIGGKPGDTSSPGSGSGSVSLPRTIQWTGRGKVRPSLFSTDFFSSSSSSSDDGEYDAPERTPSSSDEDGAAAEDLLWTNRVLRDKLRRVQEAARDGSLAGEDLRGEILGLLGEGEEDMEGCV
ncbi:hypothetical protein F4810DRAFT_710927 [Camillea tinctor]|nr:hypothetical protein F4810DRAFT_710927 [Camillea tinctor]